MAAAVPDGWLLFTDPGYGGLMDCEGHRLPASAKSAQPVQKEALYRIDAPGKVEKVADEPAKPNGLGLSPDYRKVYVADTGASHYPGVKSGIWSYDVDGMNSGIRGSARAASSEMARPGWPMGFAATRRATSGPAWAGIGDGL